MTRHTTAHHAGTPCWADLYTTDADAAQRFYGGLFGWTFEDQGAEFGHYHVISSDGGHVGGVMAQMPGQEMPPAWTTFLAVDDLDAAVARATAAGATLVVEPMEVADNGAMAQLTDPQGAYLGLWRAGRNLGFQVTEEPGAPAWFELMTTDFDAAKRFYADVFGHEFVDMSDEAAGMRYATVPLPGAGDDTMASGIGELDPDRRGNGLAPRWDVYFAVSDAREVVAAAERAGGGVVAPVQDTEYGSFAQLRDPQGATFGIIRPVDATGEGSATEPEGAERATAGAPA